MTGASRMRTWDGGVKMTDASAEALSRVAARERGEFVHGRYATSPATWRKLRDLGLLTGQPGHLRLTDEGKRVAASLPSWGWAS